MLHSLLLLKFHAAGADSINQIIKYNINYLAHQLVYIFCLSFKQGVFSLTIKRRNCNAYLSCWKCHRS